MGRCEVFCASVAITYLASSAYNYFLQQVVSATKQLVTWFDQLILATTNQRVRAHLHCYYIQACYTSFVYLLARVDLRSKHSCGIGKIRLPKLKAKMDKRLDRPRARQTKSNGRRCRSVNSVWFRDRLKHWDRGTLEATIEVLKYCPFDVSVASSTISSLL